MSKKFISYDPNFAGDANEDDDLEADEDDGWGDDEDFGGDNDAGDIDDSAWKVRKAAVKIIDALALSCGSQLKKTWIKLVQTLIDRFSERDNNVKCEVFMAFQSLIRTSIQADEDSKMSSMLTLVRRTTYRPQLKRAASSTFDWEH